ncbi:MAG TPA: winged helix-turn-helix domain-containing protein [Nitrososphaerales archaeon]|nr:winged helix-turn-helix domain-containing protein [Nitrososphaerales archaeon]
MQVFDTANEDNVVKALSDKYSRKIVLSIIPRSLSVEEIGKQQNIPISTCYRRIHELQSCGIVRIEKTVIEKDGKKYVCYRASFKDALISLESGELRVSIIPNMYSSDREYEMWSSVKDSAKLEEPAAHDAAPIPLLQARVNEKR